MTPFIVQLNQFDGPMDLMLHLIREKKLNLFELNIDVLIDQYVMFIHSVDNKLEIAAEYLYELANLIEIKSYRCLPVEAKGLDDDIYVEDPHATLVRRLIEYQQFKDVSDMLNERYQERILQHEKPIESRLIHMAEDVDVTLYNANQADLMKAMQRCLQRFQHTHPREVRITKIEMSVEERMDQLIAMISTLKEPFMLDDLIQDSHHLAMFVITFLAILELIRIDFLQVELSRDELVFRKGLSYEFVA
jgi:segregation and condensation protein A